MKKQYNCKYVATLTDGKQLNVIGANKNMVAEELKKRQFSVASIKRVYPNKG